uniref:Putative LOV domain-containing protein n=1 Tax=Dictyopteris undulata TaxID=156997 RepID=A0A126WZI8_9PHAE|nr:putative LOV domain-containing protein [Dictyopteris undulata]
MDAMTDENDMEPAMFVFGTGSASSFFEVSGATPELGFVQDDGFIASHESGGILLNAGHWSVSTSAHGESVQWSVVNERLLDPWASTPKEAGGPGPIPGSRGKSESASTGFSGVVKPDPEEERESMVTMNEVETGVSVDSRACCPPTASGGEPTSEGQQASSQQALKDTNIGGRSAGQGILGSLREQSGRVATVAATASSLIFEGKAEDGDKELDEDGDVEEEEEDEEDKDNDDEEDFRKGDDVGAEPTSDLSEKRRRNREHAKRSRMRKRMRLGGLEEMVLELRRENVRLRQMVKKGIPDRAEDIIRTCASDNADADLVAKQDVVQGMRPSMAVTGASGWGSRFSGGSRTRPKVDSRHSGNKYRSVPSALKLMSPSYQSVKALSESQANFILTNPNLPGCPIIFASPGFVDLTGYEASQVIGKNCRFLQGPGTDPVTVSIIRKNLAEGRDTSVCILNYKADGTPFWNQLSIGNLLDSQGQVANNVGVLCEVKQMPAADFHRLLHRVPLPESLLNDTSSDSGDEAADSKSFGRSRNAGGRSMADGVAGAPAYPRVVDRLRRTRAASAIDQAASQTAS